MKIKSLHIKNFKSLVDLEIVDPNPFTVFVGANGVGKSNIFEALEFVSYSENTSLHDLFGGLDAIQTFGLQSEPNIVLNALNLTFSIEYADIFDLFLTTVDSPEDAKIDVQDEKLSFKRFRIREKNSQLFTEEVLKKISRIFIGKVDYLKLKLNSDQKLNLACSNLEKVLKRLLKDENKREEIIEYFQLFIPEFENIEIHSDNIGGTDSLLIYEKGSKKPFNKNLISDGTYNLICLLTAIYQSDEPQFLCIEEPENGLNPFVVKELVNLFRTACEEKGHYIWLNTHSQSLVEMLTPEEIILVDKVNGETRVKQISGLNLHGIPTDEAWFSGALGGGTPW